MGSKAKVPLRKGFTNVNTSNPEEERRTMKVTIVEYENMEDSIWEGEALYASWDRGTGEFVIRGGTDRQAYANIVASLAARRKLMVEIEDTGPGQLVWRGYVGSAEFLSFESDEIECCLVMMLDDWFGIVPQFSTS